MTVVKYYYEVHTFVHVRYADNSAVKTFSWRW